MPKPKTDHDVASAAAIAGVSQATIRAHLIRGSLVGHKLKPHIARSDWRIADKDLREWIARRATGEYKRGRRWRQKEEK